MTRFNGIIEKAYIKKFRKFSNMEIQCGSKLTIIAGQNGTQKTTLLGLLAHPFSMPHEKEETDTFNSFPTVTNNAFVSKFADKFKLDATTEHAKSHEYSLYMVDKTMGDDGVFTLESINRNPNSLRLWKKGSRNAGDGYMNYPVIYLSLKRVTPIGEEKKIKVNSIEFTDEERSMIERTYKDILILDSDSYTNDQLNSSNKKHIISHPNSYSALTVSAGQDNLGSILSAILSFKRLKEAFPNEYKGGLLFIDEIESTLFPASQKKLLIHLLKFAGDYNLQIFCTTHSPSIILAASEESYHYHCKFNFLKSSGNTIIAETNITSAQMLANLTLTPLNSKPNSPKKLRVYTEDNEARLFIKTLLPREIYSRISLINANLGADELLKLKNSRIPEFSNNLIILDGDKNPPTSRNVLTLPGNTAPDKLLYNFLDQLSSDDEFWPDNQYTGCYSKQICFMNFHDPRSTQAGDLRRFYKNWFKEQTENGYWEKNSLKAFKYWKKKNSNLTKDFIHTFITKFNYCAKKQNIPLLK